MNSTGIIRRMDDLGRIVIPREIRRPLRMREGTPLEIFVDGDMVCLKVSYEGCKYKNELIAFQAGIFKAFKKRIDFLDPDGCNSLLTDSSSRILVDYNDVQDAIMSHKETYDGQHAIVPIFVKERVAILLVNEVSDGDPIVSTIASMATGFFDSLMQF